MKFEQLLHLYRHGEKIKVLPREGWVRRGIPSPESVADHSFGVALIAMFLAQEENLNLERVTATALIHDLAESIVGDITPSDEVAEHEKSSNERTATIEALGALDPDGKLIRLWDDFENLSTPEGVVVKDADRLEMALQALVYEERFVRRLDDFFEYVDARLVTRAARAVFEQLMVYRSDNQ